MSETHLDSDRLLAVAHGKGHWSADERVHLDGCAECRLEWNVVRAAWMLGRAPAEGVAPSRAAAAVVRRISTAEAAPSGSRFRPVGWALGLAAAAVLTLAVLIPRGTAPRGLAAPGEEIVMLHELDGLTVAELEAVLETIPPAANAATHVEAAPIGELSAQDLERMLHSME